MHAMQTAIIEIPPKFDGFQTKPGIMGPFEFLKSGVFRTFVSTNTSFHAQKSHYTLFMQLFSANPI